MIGYDAWLAYLLGRYAEQGGYQITACPDLPTAAEVSLAKPQVVLFPTLDCLEKAQSLVAYLANVDIPILVCSSLADESRARELGADHCLLHPLTYDGFIAAMGATKLAT
jgi:CheY-like chemotaxis protein